MRDGWISVEEELPEAEPLASPRSDLVEKRSKFLVEIEDGSYRVARFLYGPSLGWGEFFVCDVRNEVIPLRVDRWQPIEGPTDD